VTLVWTQRVIWPLANMWQMLGRCPLVLTKRSITLNELILNTTFKPHLSHLACNFWKKKMWKKNRIVLVTSQVFCPIFFKNFKISFFFRNILIDLMTFVELNLPLVTHLAKKRWWTCNMWQTSWSSTLNSWPQKFHVSLVPMLGPLWKWTWFPQLGFNT
jgi:hypothetical protein